ncbi:hypothetical protein MtrunA17_Chr3g0098071 [Medicago truncatula]|uniref:LCR-like protein n=1 Tax=Medicago truncatula TaxID=3880 RepID=I3S0U6_MEDTR|nr:unknown [Medicago truncatula]RHN67014.1 hypothetical protein MtrunA17_Chr3g0098071 [Medicago truncatula]
MAKHISQYCLLGIFCIALVLASGPTPGSSLCNNKHFLCDNPDNCLATCHVLLFRIGECFDNLCCCFLHIFY